MWILASSITGAGGGFLFGIPKILQTGRRKAKTAAGEGGEDEAGDDYHLQVNTNLTDISDWLTKIIVGLGLVKLAELPPQITAIASALAGGLGMQDRQAAMAFAYGLISCYALAGFLFGYLITRLSLSKAFSQADQEAAQKLEQIEATVASTQAKLASIVNKQGLITQTLYPERIEERKRGLDMEASKEAQIGELQQMADDYLKISHPDWAERVRLKDNAANAMAEFVLKKGIPKADIGAAIAKNYNQGLVIALAATIAVRPEPNDTGLLLAAASNTTRLHVCYRVLVALVALSEKRLIPAAYKAEVLQLLERYRAGADQSLLEMIRYTTSLINAASVS
jgi:hypothetical protein